MDFLGLSSLEQLLLSYIFGSDFPVPLFYFFKTCMDISFLLSSLTSVPHKFKIFTDSHSVSLIDFNWLLLDVNEYEGV